MNINDNSNNIGHAVGTFSTREDAEYALRELQGAGFNMDKVSVIAKNPERGDSIGGTEVTTSEQVKVVRQRELLQELLQVGCWA